MLFPVLRHSISGETQGNGRCVLEARTGRSYLGLADNVNCGGPKYTLCVQVGWTLAADSLIQGRNQLIFSAEQNDRNFLLYLKLK